MALGCLCFFLAHLFFYSRFPTDFGNKLYRIFSCWGPSLLYWKLMHFSILPEFFVLWVIHQSRKSSKLQFLRWFLWLRMSIINDIPPKSFNMAPENDGFQEELPFLGTSFSAFHVKFRGCNWSSSWNPAIDSTFSHSSHSSKNIPNSQNFKHTESHHRHPACSIQQSLLKLQIAPTIRKKHRLYLYFHMNSRKN